MELGRRIAEIRKEHDLTQEGLAEICSVTRQTISNWENGKSYPDLETLVLISDTFDVSLDALLKGDRKMVSEITKEQKHGRRGLIKIAAVVVIALVVGFLLFSFINGRDSYIPCKSSGIWVAADGKMSTSENHVRHISYVYEDKTTGEEAKVIVFTYLTGNFYTRHIRKDYNETPFISYGMVYQLDHRWSARHYEYYEIEVDEVYYLSEKYAEDWADLNERGGPKMMHETESKEELRAIVEQMKADSTLIWTRQ